MLPEFSIGGITVRSYSLLVDLAILVGLTILIVQAYRKNEKVGPWVDTAVGALLTGLLMGRLVHVLIYMAYFKDHLGETFQFWRGGLDWHGAVLGGLLGIWAVCRWRDIPFSKALGRYVFLIPVGGVFVYAGCWMVSCGHGIETSLLSNVPAIFVQELPDLYGVTAPRLISQVFGLVGSGLLIVLAAALKVKVPAQRFWIVLGAFGLMAFGIGFTRGDSVPMVGVLRIDQILDLLILLLGVVNLARQWRITVQRSETTEDDDARFSLLNL